MMIKSALSAVVAAGAITAGALGLGMPLAAAQPPPPPGQSGEVPPDWAPRKPVEVWNGQPVVWTSGWGGRWGVWVNGNFLTLSSNPVTNGG